MLQVWLVEEDEVSAPSVIESLYIAPYFGRKLEPGAGNEIFGCIYAGDIKERTRGVPMPPFMVCSFSMPFNAELGMGIQ